MSAQHRTGFFPGIVEALSTIDLSGVPGPDTMAFATGYLTGRRGLPRDPLAEELGVEGYQDGWAMGDAVRQGKVEQPSWDRT